MVGNRNKAAMGAIVKDSWQGLEVGLLETKEFGHVGCGIQQDPSEGHLWL
jgi:hypothetical protein